MTERQKVAFDLAVKELKSMSNEEFSEALENVPCILMPEDVPQMTDAIKKHIQNSFSMKNDDSILDDDVANAIKAKGLEYRIALNQFLRQTLIANCL